MYRCDGCKRKFDTPISYQGDCEIYYGRPTYDYYDGCPYCKSEDIEEIEEEDNG